MRATRSALLLAIASALLPFFGRSSSSLSSFESGSGLFCLLGACRKYSMVNLSILEPEVVDPSVLAYVNSQYMANNDGNEAGTGHCTSIQQVSSCDC